MYKKIMVPLDGSKLAECVLPHVDGFVTGCQVETIIFVRVIEPTPTHYSEVGSTVNPENYETVRKNVERIEEESRSSFLFVHLILLRKYKMLLKMEKLSLIL